MSRYTSRDGLMSSPDPEAVALWDRIVAEHTTAQAQWSAYLRSIGVKLEHPDDGWVKRDAPEPYLTLSWYPGFNDNPQVGDLIAFGSAPDTDHYRPRYTDSGVEWAWDGYRIVRVTRIERSNYLIPSVRYFYEDTGRRVPEPSSAVTLSARQWWSKVLPWKRRA